MKLAISGSRHYNNYEEFSQILYHFLHRNLLECIITGDATGADSLAEKFSIRNNIPIKIFRADWKKYGKSAGPIRNKEIISDATHLLAFPSKFGKGTQNTIDHAKNKGIPIYVYYID